MSSEQPIQEMVPSCGGEKLLTKGLSVRTSKKDDEIIVSADDDNLNSDTIGASGMQSNARSAVTKSFRRGKQGGFDEVGDNQKGVEELVILSSARAANAASLISHALGGEEEESVSNVKKFLCIPITNNVKALFVMMMAFLIITIAQYFAAAAANSQSLKADVVSMGIDALSYFGNILGEGSDIPAQRIVLQLIFSMISLFLLNYFNTDILIESIEIMEESKMCVDDGEGEGVEGKIVIAFAGLGLVFDAFCLYAYWYYSKQDAEAEYQEMVRMAEANGQTPEDAKATIKKPGINMLSALLHVSADLFRSTSTFILGIFLLSGSLDDCQQSYGDAVVGILIGATIYLASLYALYEWIVTFIGWFRGLGAPVTVECPECNCFVEIKPDKAGQGKMADVFDA